MNTFVRGPMRNEGGGLLSAEIRLPDIYGIFDFVVKFQEPGFQSIDQKFSITINPIRNGILEFVPNFVVPRNYPFSERLRRFPKNSRLEYRKSYDMYDRFIPCAFPYYLSAFSMMIGAFLMGFTVLYHEGGDVAPRPKPEPVPVTKPTPKIKAVPKRVKKRQ